MTIGEVARRAGVKPSRIRYYESRGLIETPERLGGWRRYDASVLRWLGLIDAASRLGFSLDETKVLIDGLRGHGFDSGRREALVRQKLEEAADMAARATAIQNLLNECLKSGCLTMAGEEALDACVALAGGLPPSDADRPALSPSKMSRARAATSNSPDGGGHDHG